MDDTVPMPVPGNPDSKGEPDGVSGAPDGGPVHGRSEVGESGGGAYPNPHTGHGDPKSEFFAPRGQTPEYYHGGGQAGDTGTDVDNGVAGSGGDRGEVDGERAPAPTAEHTARQVTAEHGGFSVVEASGVAEAELQGKVGTDAPYEDEQKQPGSG